MTINLVTSLMVNPIRLNRAYDGAEAVLQYNDSNQSIEYKVNGRVLCEIDEEVLDRFIERANAN